MRGMDAPAFPYLHRDFGIEILDIDLQEQLPESAWQTLRDALAKHALLVLRKQKLTSEAMQHAMLHFGARLGELQRVETRGPSEHQDWHSAVAYDGSPSIATMLCAREAPPQDGGIEFASTRTAYAALSMPEQQKISRLKGTHVFRKNPEQSVSHPIVVTHPQTQQQSLFIGNHLTALTGTPAAESERVIRHLMNVATQAERIYHHDFRPDDVLVWDNTALMHRASALRAGERRVLEIVSAYPA
jgi:taurine dioxygenase